MTTMRMRVIKAGHDTPKTSELASQKKPKGSAVWRKPKNHHQRVRDLPEGPRERPVDGDPLPVRRRGAAAGGPVAGAGEHLLEPGRRKLTDQVERRSLLSQPGAETHHIQDQEATNDDDSVGVAAILVQV